MQYLTSPRFFPILMMILSACASIRYGFDRNVGQTIYWAAAAVLSYSVTFLMETK